MSTEQALASLRHLYANMTQGAVRDTASAKRIAIGLLGPAIEALKRSTQATPDAAEAAQEDRSIVATYEKLHEGKLGAHWLWCVIEQIAAGVPEADAMRSFNYYERREAGES